MALREWFDRAFAIPYGNEAYVNIRRCDDYPDLGPMWCSSIEEATDMANALNAAVRGGKDGK